MKLILVTLLMAVLATQTINAAEEQQLDLEVQFNPIQEIICVGRLLDDLQRTFRDNVAWIASVRRNFDLLDQSRQACLRLPLQSLRDACTSANNVLRAGNIVALLNDIRVRWNRFPNEVEHIIRSFEACRRS